MSMLIIIKSKTEVYDSPNVGYHCGNTFPWFYNDGIVDITQPASEISRIPFTCTQKPKTCDSSRYYMMPVDLETTQYKTNITEYVQLGKCVYCVLS